MTTRKLEPVPGWCERAREAMQGARDGAYISQPMKYESKLSERMRVLIAEYEAAQRPAPAEEKAPHQADAWIHGNFLCRHCRQLLDEFYLTASCPARTPKPEYVQSADGWVSKPKPGAEQRLFPNGSGHCPGIGDYCLTCGDDGPCDCTPGCEPRPGAALRAAVHAQREREMPDLPEEIRNHIWRRWHAMQAIEIHRLFCLLLDEVDRRIAAAVKPGARS